MKQYQGKPTEAINAPIKSNSSFGNYAVPCRIQYPWRTIDGFVYFWTQDKAQEFYSVYKAA